MEIDQSPYFDVYPESFPEMSIDFDQFIMADFVTTFPDLPFITLLDEPFQELSPMDDTPPADDFALISTGVGEFNLVPESPLISISAEESPEVVDLIQDDLHQPEPLKSEESDLVVQNKRLKKTQKNAGGGCNRFGRKGTRRCEVCRSWRRKVQSSIFPADFY
jgi:hypothetical protein